MQIFMKIRYIGNREEWKTYPPACSIALQLGGGHTETKFACVCILGASPNHYAAAFVFLPLEATRCTLENPYLTQMGQKFYLYVMLCLVIFFRKICTVLQERLPCTCVCCIKDVRKHSTLFLDEKFALSLVSRTLFPDNVILGISHLRGRPLYSL